jgi:hypothetical protein
MEIVQKLHRVPKIIISDRDTIFNGNVWNELFYYLGTQLAHITSCHPQSNRKIDIVNKLLEAYIRFLTSDK